MNTHHGDFQIRVKNNTLIVSCSGAWNKEEMQKLLDEVIIAVDNSQKSLNSSIFDLTNLEGGGPEVEQGLLEFNNWIENNIGNIIVFIKPNAIVRYQIENIHANTPSSPVFVTSFSEAKLKIKQLLLEYSIKFNIN